MKGSEFEVYQTGNELTFTMSENDITLFHTIDRDKVLTLIDVLIEITELTSSGIPC